MRMPDLNSGIIEFFLYGNKLKEPELKYQFAVQIVSVYRTKCSRGHPTAGRRNQISRAVPMMPEGSN